MYERMTGMLILHVLTERTPDVLKRLKNLLSRLNTYDSTLFCIIKIYVTNPMPSHYCLGVSYIYFYNTK
jgi:hypothetical protein